MEKSQGKQLPGQTSAWPPCHNGIENHNAQQIKSFIQQKKKQKKKTLIGINNKQISVFIEKILLTTKLNNTLYS
jgi:hypothetical protein